MKDKNQQAKNEGLADVLRNAEMQPESSESGPGRFLDIFTAMFCSSDDEDERQKPDAASRGDD